MISALRGMKDLMPPQSDVYLYFIENCSRIAKNYGYEYINTPILEESALFKRSVGESSDIVGKEMYQFIDKGNNDVCMRPEGTAGVVRAFIQNKMDKAKITKRFYYYGPMFRYERPQKGRLRQFHQFGVESFGVDNIKEDATIILMLHEILSFFKINSTLKLNSVGNKDCMPSYKEKLKEFLDTKDDLCDDCKRRKLSNPIRVFDCKNENCQKLLTNAPLLLDNLCSSCEEDFENLKKILNHFQLPFEIDPRLVRGLDYYSKTAFEFVSNEIGAQSSIAGGGRYDRLVEFLDGEPTAGIGFAIGVERLMELIQIPTKKRDGIYIGSLCKESEDLAYDLSIKLCKKTYVQIDYKYKSFKSHLKNIDKMNAKYFICIGEDELKSEKITIKNLETKKEIQMNKELLGDYKW